MCNPLEPGVPGGIHAAEVVGATGGRYQLPHLALCPVKLRQRGEPAGDRRDRLAHQTGEESVSAVQSTVELFRLLS